MRVARFVLVVVGVVTLIVGLALGAAGSALLWANATQRDASGYFTTPKAGFESGGVAVVSSVDLTMQPGAHEWNYRPLGTLRVRANVANAAT